MIDPQLEKAGWYLRDHSKVKIEIPVDGYDAKSENGITDFCQYRENGEVLAVVEAKTRTTMGLIDVFMRSNQARWIFHRL